MAILEEIDEDVEQKSTSQAKRKAAPAGNSKMGAGARAAPKGMGFTRGFLKPKPQSVTVPDDEGGEFEKSSNAMLKPESKDNANLASEDPTKLTSENSAEPVSENPSKFVTEITADQEADEEGLKAESAKTSPSKGLARGFLKAPLKAASQAGRSHDLESGAIDQPPLAGKHGRSAEGFARGFLNPKRQAPTQSTVGAVPNTSTGIAEVSGRGTTHASKDVAEDGGEGGEKQMEGENLAAEANADVVGRNATVSESGVPAVETVSHGGAPQQADVEDTWSVETQISDRSEMHEEAASIWRGGRGAADASLHEALEFQEQVQDGRVGAGSQSVEAESESVSGSSAECRETSFAAGGLKQTNRKGDDRRSEGKEGGPVGMEGEGEGGNKEVFEKVLNTGGTEDAGSVRGGEEGRSEGEKAATEGVVRANEALKGGELPEGRETQGIKRKGGEDKGTVKTGEAGEKEEEKASKSEKLNRPTEEHREKAGRPEEGTDDWESDKFQEEKSASQDANERAEDKFGNGEGTADAAVVQQGESSSKEGEWKDGNGENEEEEEEFHDACEDEEQQRKQALMQAEQARARGNELYATANYERALEVYSKALQLAPPAYVTAETTPEDKETPPKNEEASPQKEAETPQNEESAPETSGERTGETEPAAREKTDAEGGLNSDADQGGFGGVDQERLGSGTGGQRTGEGRGGPTETSGRRRRRPPRVLDPKTGRLVVPDEDSGGGSSGSGPGGAESGASDGGGEEATATEQQADQEAINCRAACHANRAACFVQLGLHDAAVRECSEALKLKPDYLKVIIRRAQAYDKLDKQEEALADWKTVLEKDPANRQARKELSRLEPIVNEKREKMKEEMLGKLKELGNSLLGHFGLSVDNFKAVQDPNTGGYSINFSK